MKKSSKIFSVISIYKRAYSGLPRQVWLLSLVLLINRSGTMVLFFLTLYFTTRLDYSVAAAGRMISIYGLGSLLGAFAGGWLTDRLGTSKILIWSLVLSGIGYIILGYLKEPLSLTVTLFLVAATSEAFRPANATALAAACPPELRSRGFAMNRLAANLGVTIGPAVGGFLATVDYHYLFITDALTCLIAAFVFWLFMVRYAPPAVVVPSAPGSLNSSPLRDPTFLFILVLMLILGTIFVQVFNTWPIYLKSVYGLNEPDIGTLLALNALLIVLVEMPLIHSIEKKNPMRIISLGAFLLFFGFMLTPLHQSYLFAAFTVIIWTTGEMLVFPLITSHIANRADDSNRGKYMGMSTFTLALSFVIGPLYGTAVYDRFGGTVLWLSIGAIGALAFTGFRVLDMRSRE